jgi:hypothetical protein
MLAGQKLMAVGRPALSREMQRERVQAQEPVPVWLLSVPLIQA